jgi:hypothetical protein
MFLRRNAWRKTIKANVTLRTMFGVKPSCFDEIIFSEQIRKGT